ncbi:LysE family transporter [Streptomyces olivoreticuli]|uniref:LysE family translocator n=1 Tax=Streptomyces olivoreticuli TaxID=68246 RepID=UPI00265870B4|nr:LysE family transporter [Streptomyces olivoreticuli]WKK25155.1 LysE family transporter [Streptomyces olivoreticuli]
MEELALGVALGFSAGISPGPLLALVLSGTLRGGLGVGLRVAAVPLITDLPVIILSVTVLSVLPGRAVSAGGVIGGLFLAWLAASTIRESRTAEIPAVREAAVIRAEGRRTLRQGVLINLLSPHPWVFWLTTGAPLLVAAWRDSPPGAGGFLLGFYALLVGSKAALALIVARARHRIGTRGYRLLLGGSGVLLLAASALLLVEFGSALAA